MDILGAVFIGILLIFIAVVYFFDPLEKYDKTLDDPNHKDDRFIKELYLGKGSDSVINIDKE